jgi:hypothetical protein
MVKKAHILQEIKRAAEANGGKPLGTARFEAETGIKKADWFGVFWSRFGDAVREAGYAPNQLKTRYEETKLFEKYATLAQELGRLPVKGELILKRRSDPDFPSGDAFYRLGAKLEFIGQLLVYCKGREAYDDVVRMCEEYKPHNREKLPESTSGKAEFGVVYLVKSARFYKIGRSNAAGRREYELGLQLPEKLKMIHMIRTDDPSGIEVYWHKRFETKRKNGEWFELDAADVAAFKRRKFM